MLAFLVDQTQQLCCALFQSVWKKLGSKISLWESIRSCFKCFLIESMEMLYKSQRGTQRILHGIYGMCLLFGVPFHINQLAIYMLMRISA